MAALANGATTALQPGLFVRSRYERHSLASPSQPGPVLRNVICINECFKYRLAPSFGEVLIKVMRRQPRRTCQ